MCRLQSRYPAKVVRDLPGLNILRLGLARGRLAGVLTEVHHSGNAWLKYTVTHILICGMTASEQLPQDPGAPEGTKQAADHLVRGSASSGTLLMPESWPFSPSPTLETVAEVAKGLAHSDAEPRIRNDKIYPWS
jgi:hypothetical protein